MKLPHYISYRALVFFQILFVFLALQRLSSSGDIRIFVGIHPIQQGLMLIFFVYQWFLYEIMNHYENFFIISRISSKRNQIKGMMSSITKFAIVFVGSYFALLLLMSNAVLSLGFVIYLFMYYLFILLLYVLFSNTTIFISLYFESTKVSFILPTIISIIYSVKIYNEYMASFIYPAIDKNFIIMNFLGVVIINTFLYLLIANKMKDVV